MSSAPLVLVTSTTEVTDGRSRVCLNEACTEALVVGGLIPVVLPPVSPALAIAALSEVAGLVLTGGEDIDPRHYPEVGGQWDAEELTATDEDWDCRLFSALAGEVRGASLHSVSIAGIR